MQIRKAEEKDIKELLEIYNYEVLNGVATFDLIPKTTEEWTEWFLSHNIGNHPLLVAEEEGRVCGYASLSPYRTKEAYHSTVELSIYISPDDRKKGIATALMKEILQMANDDPDIHTVVSVITGGNTVSRRLHQKFGFEFCGTMREVGIKFGRYLDIDNYTLNVDE